MFEEPEQALGSFGRLAMEPRVYGPRDHHELGGHVRAQPMPVRDQAVEPTRGGVEAREGARAGNGERPAVAPLAVRVEGDDVAHAPTLGTRNAFALRS